MWTIFKVFIEFVTISLLIYVMIFFGWEACGIIFPPPGIEPALPDLKVKSCSLGYICMPPTPFFKQRITCWMWLSRKCTMAFIFCYTHLALNTKSRDANQSVCPVRACVLSNSIMSLWCWLCVTPWTVAHQAPCPWDPPGKNTGVGCHSLLQGIFPIQGLNPCLLHGEVDSFPLAPPGKPCWYSACP